MGHDRGSKIYFYVLLNGQYTCWHYRCDQKDFHTRHLHLRSHGKIRVRVKDTFSRTHQLRDEVRAVSEAITWSRCTTRINYVASTSSEHGEILTVWCKIQVEQKQQYLSFRSAPPTSQKGEKIGTPEVFVYQTYLGEAAVFRTISDMWRTESQATVTESSTGAPFATFHTAVSRHTFCNTFVQTFVEPFLILLLLWRNYTSFLT
jgi:hypothetical protein